MRAETAPDPIRASGEPSRLAQVTVLAAAAMTIMAAALIAPSLPAMTAEYAGSDVLVRLALTITSLAIALTAPFAGLVADRAGRRPLLIASLGLYALAGTAGYIAPGLGLLLASRAVLGVAVGGLMTAIGAVITDWFGGRRRAAFLGLQQASASLGGVVFLPLSGVLAQSSWRTPFLVYAAAAVLLPLAVLFVREPSRATAGTTSPDMPGTARVGAEIAGIYGLALVATVIFFMAPTQLPFSLSAFAVGPVVTGLVVAGSTLTGAIGALLFPVLRRRLGTTAITAASLGALGGGWVIAGTATSLGQVVAGVLIGGVGIGLSVPNLTLRLAELAHPARRARVLSGLVVAIFLGQFLSPLALQPVIDAVGINGTFTWSGLALVLAGVGVAAAVRSAGPRQHRDRAVLTGPGRAGRGGP